MLKDGGIRMIKYFRTRNNIYMLETIDIFMKNNPPCKECLVRGMCLLVFGTQKLKTKSCNMLYEFLINSEYFGMPEIKPIMR